MKYRKAKRKTKSSKFEKNKTREISPGETTTPLGKNEMEITVEVIRKSKSKSKKDTVKQKKKRRSG
jgi:hypothetical protein